MTYSTVEFDAFTKNYLATVPDLDLEKTPLAVLREMIPKAPLEGVDVKERQFTSREGRDITVTVVRPPGTEQDTLPAILFLHGGGFVFGDINLYAELLSKLSNGTNAAILFVHYSLSPEVRFPVAVEECYDALEWCIKENESLKIDPGMIAVGGDSAGGNLSAVLCLLAKQRSKDLLSAIKYQFLLYPCVDAESNTASFNEFQEGYVLTRKAMAYVLDAYLPNEEDRKKITASPLNATLDDLKDLPPALIMTAEADVLRNEGEAYARRLTAAGVYVTATRYLGSIHGFFTMPLTTPYGKAALFQLVSLLKDVFRQ
ncbi:hypothetical protein DFQ28_006627 [Apophysomyces sp. BC1034]|nr:hypothetical protein DFQ30_003360 [Apophysomyces sp. BC1015]KAG0182988.1 hypothetical protein DFQ29_000799 [Apophysomyces sp. BC1021]KAG0194778.1 hypothetical protein DFQ28_006627 [Apophysomyces sp. BC1034]